MFARLFTNQVLESIQFRSACGFYVSSSAFRPQKTEHQVFMCLKHSLRAFLEIKIPMLISVESKLATYHHVVVVWREMITDYESMYMYPLTEDTLRQIWGVNTTFRQISCGYGILPLKIFKALETNQNIQDWGIAELYKPGSSIRKYFYWW
jgi:hypothetical protein